MLQWVTAKEIAGLPGVAARANDIPRQAKREGWESRKRQGRGGGQEYLAARLPAATRAALAAKVESEASRAGQLEARKLDLAERIADEFAHKKRLTGLKESLHQTEDEQRAIDAKLAVLSAFEQFRRAAGIAVRRARPDFARRYNAGEIAVEPWVRASVPTVSKTSLWEWERLKHNGDLARLTGKHGRRSRDGVIDRQPEIEEFLVSMLVSYPHTTVANIQKAMRARFDGKPDVLLLHRRTVERWIVGWKRENKQTFTALTNPDAWKSGYMVAFGSHSADVSRVNQRWELDSTPGDVMLTDGRHAVIGVIDVHSRRARLFVSKTSKATAIATLLRHALLDWGVPEVAKTDNGSDYTSNHIKRVFQGLEIEQELCPPFQPWHKPHIERFFGTFTRGLVELLPGFIGHNVAEREAIEARRSFAERLMKRGQEIEVSMSAAEFQKFCDDWCEQVYAHAPHEGLKGKTPFEILAAHRGPIRKVTDARALDVLLADAPANNGRRTVQKKGIELDRAWFIAPELEAHVGEDVFVRLDPLDLGRIYVFDAEEGFVCVAEAPERTGMDRQVVAAKAREMQKARVQQERAALRATARRVNTDDVVREILEDRAEAAGKLSRLPGRSSAHASAGLQEAGKAARSRDLPEGESISPAERAALDAEVGGNIAQISRAKRSECPLLPEENLLNYEMIDFRIAAGESVSDEERVWHTWFKESGKHAEAVEWVNQFPLRFFPELMKAREARTKTAALLELGGRGEPLRIHEKR